jgi:hypothetical protein
MTTQISQQTAGQAEAQTGVLSSWKDIAKYAGKGVRTVQRWEQQLGLPVRRPAGRAGKSVVLVYRSDLEEWMATHFSIRTAQKHQETGSYSTTRGTLRQSVQTRQEVCDAIQKLSEQIGRAALQLAEQCDPSSSALSIEVSWSVRASRKPNGTCASPSRSRIEGTSTISPYRFAREL